MVYVDGGWWMFLVWGVVDVLVLVCCWLFGVGGLILFLCLVLIVGCVVCGWLWFWWWWLFWYCFCRCCYGWSDFLVGSEGVGWIGCVYGLGLVWWIVCFCRRFCWILWLVICGGCGSVIVICVGVVFWLCIVIVCFLGFWFVCFFFWLGCFWCCLGGWRMRWVVVVCCCLWLWFGGSVWLFWVYLLVWFGWFCWLLVDWSWWCWVLGIVWLIVGLLWILVWLFGLVRCIDGIGDVGLCGCVCGWFCCVVFLGC